MYFFGSFKGFPTRAIKVEGLGRTPLVSFKGFLQEQ